MDAIRIPDTQLEPLYQAESTGLALSNDYLAFQSYIEWNLRTAYLQPAAVTN